MKGSDFMLYHGSKYFIKDELEPRMSFACKKLVYATDNYFYALVRAGKFDMTKALIREDYKGPDRPYQLVEVVPGAFEEVFNCKGYIYEVDERSFISSPDVSEFISEHNVKVERCIVIENVYEELLKNIEHYELVPYENSEEIWKTVRGGREGYLERRAKRLEQITQALKES
jgi:hypothetical protein